MTVAPRHSVLRVLTVVVCCVITFGPLAWFVLMGFADREAMLTGWPRFSALSLANYRALVERIPLGRCIGDSMSIALGSAILAILLSAPAGYFASRGRGRLSHNVYTLSLSLWLVPPIALSLEVYFWFLHLHLYDSALGLTLLYGVLHSTLVLVILTPYLDAIPMRIDELAWMDGLGDRRVLGSVHWPLLRNLILGLFAVAFVRSWNELLFGTILTDSRVRTLSVTMLGLTTGSHLEWGQIAALSTIALVPVPAALVCIEIWQFSQIRLPGGHLR